MAKEGRCRKGLGKSVRGEIGGWAVVSDYRLVLGEDLNEVTALRIARAAGLSEKIGTVCKPLMSMSSVSWRIHWTCRAVLLSPTYSAVVVLTTTLLLRREVHETMHVPYYSMVVVHCTKCSSFVSVSRCSLHSQRLIL